MSRLATIEEVSNELIDDLSLSISSQFTCSIHNCRCERAKVGLILYPKDIQLKNLILLLCHQCCHYRNDIGLSAHQQLEQWYFRIYRDAESFRFKSRFIQNEDQSIAYHNLHQWEITSGIEERELISKETQLIQQVIAMKRRN